MSIAQATAAGARLEGTKARIIATDVAALKRKAQECHFAMYPEWNHTPVIPKGITNLVGVARASLSAREREIVEQDAVSLLQAYEDGRYTVVEVTRAFCHAALVAHRLTNCLTEVFFDEGLKRAQRLDDYFAAHGVLAGPLHGIPVSIKDHILVLGYDTSSGYAGWAGQTVADRDAMVVTVLRQAGAILYLKTANPQTLLSLETNNNIYGRTVNPYNVHLSPGGSSGGESALIALCGSVMGVGTDIGGSIRIPAAHCGLYGLKGSNARLPHAGLMGSHNGMDNIVGSLGPITRSARDLALFAKTMLDAEPWLVEPQILEIPWRQELLDHTFNNRSLSIAIVWDDGVAKPHPPILRALGAVRRALTAAGHDVVDWEPMDNHHFAWDLITKLYFLDGADEYRTLMRDTNDPPVPQTEWILTFAPDKAYTIPETWELNVQRENFRTKLAAHWLATQKRTKSGRPVDVVLSPVAPTLAPPHDTTRWWGYTSYWNLADYPGVVFPLRENTPTEHELPVHPCSMGAAPRNPTEEFIAKQWDPKVYENAPVSLQLVSRRLNEEKLLGALNVVESAMKAANSS